MVVLILKKNGIPIVVAIGMPDIGDYFMETSGKWTLACLLLQFKHYGNCEFTTDRFASLLTGVSIWAWWKSHG